MARSGAAGHSLTGKQGSGAICSRGVSEEDAPHYPHLIQPHDMQWFAVLANGTIISQWQPRSGEGIPKSALWGSVREHPLEPVWSRGIPGFVPPQDPLLAYISRKMGVELDPGLDLRDKSWARDDRTEMSHCGRALAKLPADLRDMSEMITNPDMPRYVPCHLSHFAWDAALQKMSRRDPHFTAAHVHAQLAWHPQAASSSLIATVGYERTVLLVDATKTASQNSWLGNTLRNFWRQGFARFEPLGYHPWDFMAWSPDGTKLFMQGSVNGEATVIDFMQAACAPNTYPTISQQLPGVMTCLVYMVFWAMVTMNIIYACYSD